MMQAYSAQCRSAARRIVTEFGRTKSSCSNRRFYGASSLESVHRRGNTITIETLQTRTLDENWILPTFIHLPPNPKPNPLLLISGWTGVSADWGSLPKMISSRSNRPVITYDPRHLGFSKRIGDNKEEELKLTLDLMTDDAIQVAQQGLLHIQKKHELESPNSITLAGASMGGMIAQNFAQQVQLNDQRIQNVVSMILIATTPGVKQLQSPRLRSFFKCFQGWPQDKTKSASQFFLALGESYNGCVVNRSKHVMKQRFIEKFILSRDMHEQVAQNPFLKGVTVQYQALREPFDSTTYLKHLGIPSLVIHGADDSVISKEAAELLHQHLSHSKLVIIPDCDHLCWLTYPLFLVDSMCNFLACRTPNL